MAFDMIDAYLLENSWLKFELMADIKEGKSDIVRQRKSTGEFSKLYETLRLDDNKFYEYTRMSVGTFDYILEKIEPCLKLATTNFHISDSITPTEKLIVTLRFLATGTSFRSLAFSFRMGKTTIANIVYTTCSALWVELVNEHMPYPTCKDLKEIASDYFKLWQFPMCVGAVDGKNCRVRCPAKCGSSFSKHKNYFSIILQGIANAKQNFIAIEVGGKGKQGDEGTYYLTLKTLMENGKLNIPPPDFIPGTTTRSPYVLVANEGYPLKENIMRPFPSRNLDDKKKHFNKRLSCARKPIDGAFGMLYARWRILGKDIETSVEHACLIIKATCILHNIIQNLEGITTNEHFLISSEVGLASNELSRRNNSSSLIARNVRNQLLDYFWENKR